MDVFSFLAITTPFVMLMIIVGTITDHRRKSKKLDIEALKVQQSNLQNEVDDAVQRNLGNLAERIEVLEAIVTDKNYDLSEKITRLK